MKKFVALLLILMIVPTLLAFQEPEDPDESPDREGGTALSATLTGAAEVPGPGDPDGEGQALIRLFPSQGEVCFEINVSNIQLPATGAHIHIGSSGFAGPVVVTLAPPDDSGHSEGCVDNQDPEVLKLIKNNPSVFYVNVHNEEFPAGAVRGQLSGGDEDR